VPTRTHLTRRHPTWTVASLFATFIALVAACGSGSVPASALPSGTDPVASPLARTTPAVLADQAALDGSLIAVSGFFTTDGTTHLVCDAILESYPPQCGGATIVVLGTIPAAALALLETPDDPNLARVSWGSVEVRGTFHAAAGGARPTIELTEIRVVTS
jgi:hypothetical protein